MYPETLFKGERGVIFSIIPKWIKGSLTILDMKTNTLLLPLSLLLLLSAGCGKAVEKAIKKSVKGIGNGVECGLANSFGVFGQSLAPDYDVKMYRSTVNMVLDDLRAKKNVTAVNFWSSLDPATRDALNYELNLHMVNQRTTSPLAVYQSIAYFFTGVQKNFDETVDYKVRDSAGKVYAFKIRAVDTKSTMLFNYVCGRHVKTDLTAIKVGPEVLKLDEVKEIFECRSVTKSMILMEMKEHLYLMAGKTLHKLPASQLNKKDKNRRLELSFESNEVSFKLKIKKKREEEVEDWTGRRSDIELISNDYAMDEEGGCNTLLHSLEGE